MRERLLDAIAARLGIDPVEVRRRNLIAQTEMPYERPLDAIGDEIVYDSGDYAGLMDKALAAVGWDALQAAMRRRRDAGEAVGTGLAIFVEKSGLGPTDRVTISVDDAGIVEVVTGGASVGQGFETVMAQIAPMRWVSTTAGCGSSTGTPTGSSTGSGRMPRARR